MNKKLIIKQDILGSFIVCPYCKQTIMNYDWYKSELSTLAEEELKKVHYSKNRYGTYIKFCTECGAKLNFRNLQVKILKKITEE